MNFQSILLYCISSGAIAVALIAQPYDIEKAGTKNPHLLRAIGPEPGQLPMLNLCAAPRMGATVKTPIASNTITSTSAD